jgi:hypothetical protein
MKAHQEWRPHDDNKREQNQTAPAPGVSQVAASASLYFSKLPHLP